MRAFLSALAIVAYIATTRDAAGELLQASHLAWFDTRDCSRNTGSRPVAHSAKAINPYCTEMQFRRERHPNAIILKADSMQDYGCYCGQANPVCLNLLGIDLNDGQQIFCNLVSIAITRLEVQHLHIILHFESQISKLRLHIPVMLMRHEEAYERMKEFEESEFVEEPAFLLSFSRLRDIRNYNPVWYNFLWLANLLRDGVIEYGDNSPMLYLEGSEDGAEEYETRAVLISENAFWMICEVIEDDTLPLIDL